MSMSLQQWQRLGAETLLHFLWQGMLIACVVDVVFRLLATRPPNQRYAVGLIGMLAMAGMPLITLAVLMPAPSTSVHHDSLVGESMQSSSVGPAPGQQAIKERSQIVTVAQEMPSGLDKYQPWIVGGWIIGVLLLGSRLLMGFVGFYRWSWSRSDLPVQLVEIVSRLTTRLKIACPRVFLSSRVPEALALGILRPIVLVPASWLTDLPLPMLEAVLAHELAHLRRYDLLMNLLQRVVETLLFYHPAVWWLSSRVRQDRELCCDALAVAVTCDRVTYARTLEHVARLIGSQVEWSGTVGIGGRHMHLLHRVQSVLGLPASCKSRSWCAGFLTIAVPAVLCWLALSVQPEPIRAAEAPNDLLGRVVDQTGNPVSGITIQALLYRDLIRDFKADAEGRFRVPHQWWSQNEGVTLIAKAPGQLGWVAYLKMKNAIDGHGFQIMMIPLTRQVGGQLIDEKSHPLADVTVKMEGVSHGTNGYLAAWDWDEELRLPMARADKEGRFKFTIPQTDHAELWIRHPDWVAEVVPVANGKEDLGKITVAKAGRIEGRITDAMTGGQISGIRIGAQYVNAGGRHFAGSGYGETTTNQEGRYLIGGLLPGQYNLLLSETPKHPKLVAPAKEGVVVEAGKTVTMNLRAREGRRLAGKVIDVETGKPFPQCHVGYYGADRPRSGAGCKMVKTDEQGNFEFYVSPGPSYVYIAQGHQMGLDGSTRTVDVPTDRDFTDLILRASKKTQEDFGIRTMAVQATPDETKKNEADQDYRLRLQLRTSDGRGVNGVYFHWIRDRHVTIEGTFSGNRYEGMFSSNMVGGNYTLLIDADGFAPALSKEFAFTRRMEPLIVDLQPATYVHVRGRILDADGKPLAGARVRAGRVIATERIEFPWGVETATDALGQYELKHLRVGERLFVYADRKDVGGAQSPRFLLAGDAPNQLEDLRMATGNRTLEGVVTNYNGDPLAGVVVKAIDGFSQDQDSKLDQGVKTNAQGHFRFEGLLPGKLGVQVDAPGYRMSTRHETYAGAKNVHVYMASIPDPKAKHAVLEVELRPKNGGEVAQTDFWLVELGNYTRLSSAWTGNKTTITFDELLRPKPGVTYALVLAARGFALPKPVVLKLGELDKPLIVALEPAAPVALTGRIVDEKGQPVAGARLGLSLILMDGIVEEPWRYLERGSPELPVTDAAGSFRIPDLLPGSKVALYVNKAGYAGATTLAMTLAPGHDMKLGDIRLAGSDRTIKGIVIDAKGKPVPGARITSHDLDNVSATTGSGGTFLINKAPHRTLTLFIDAEDCATVSREVPAGTSELKIQVKDEEDE